MVVVVVVVVMEVVAMVVVAMVVVAMVVVVVVVVAAAANSYQHEWQFQTSPRVRRLFFKQGTPRGT